mmetsp:Transcript_58233/g.69451  ORF Transcript_58233/g.69451 Transcript_58233/m.69451 type:complete len:302 (-) Transcript_58233:452-1357(-)
MAGEAVSVVLSTFTVAFIVLAAFVMSNVIFWPSIKAAWLSVTSGEAALSNVVALASLGVACVMACVVAVVLSWTTARAECRGISSERLGASSELTAFLIFLALIMSAAFILALLGATASGSLVGAASLFSSAGVAAGAVASVVVTCWGMAGSVASIVMSSSAGAAAFFVMTWFTSSASVGVPSSLAEAAFIAASASVIMSGAAFIMASAGSINVTWLSSSAFRTSLAAYVMKSPFIVSIITSSVFIALSALALTAFAIIITSLLATAALESSVSLDTAGTLASLVAALLAASSSTVSLAKY